MSEWPFSGGNLGIFAQLLVHFTSLSLLSVGGAITAVPDMHRYLVTQQGWMTDAQFSASVAIAQAAPGPNVLFVALMGWHVGLNAAGGLDQGFMAWLMALTGMSLSMLGILLPSTCLTWLATRWGRRNHDKRSVRAFKQGMAPIVIGLLGATSWTLASAHGNPRTDWPLWLLSVAAALIVWRTRIHLLWLLGSGALLGALGWV